MNLFKKAAVFTDIHFGKKSDSEEHNKDCLEYVEWFCNEVREADADTVIFMGDWFDNRSRLRVDTIDYSWQAIELLAALKREVWWLAGNHDLFFRNHRSVHSLPYLTNKFHIVNELLEVGDCLMAPWLVGNEFSEVPGYDVKYIFGHFELPLFLLNENVSMPDRGGLHADHFTECDAVFSGHFHKRQLKVNDHGIPVWYIGNCFPHDFNDVDDTNRGCMMLEWGNEPEFINWENAPNYHRTTLSTIISHVEGDTLPYNNKSVVECRDDIGIEIEEAMEFKSVLGPGMRDLRLRPARTDLDVGTETDIDDNAKSVDEMVVEHLNMIDTDGSDYDSDVLVQLYNSVIVD
jgi:hypothetical protein